MTKRCDAHAQKREKVSTPAKNIVNCGLSHGHRVVINKTIIFINLFVKKKLRGRYFKIVFYLFLSWSFYYTEYSIFSSEKYISSCVSTYLQNKNKFSIY